MSKKKKPKATELPTDTLGYIEQLPSDDTREEFPEDEGEIGGVLPIDEPVKEKKLIGLHPVTREKVYR